MRKIIIDCHNHTKWSKFDTKIKGSDWLNYIEDYAKIAKENNFTMCAITEHDIINKKLKELLSNTEILVPEAVEISAKNYDRNKSLHILYYAKNISQKINKILEKVLFLKKQVLEKQILLLQKYWFILNIEEVKSYIKENWLSNEWLNKWKITQYMFLWKHKEHNTKNLYKLFPELKNNNKLKNENDLHNWFYYNCMKSEWKYYKQFEIKNIIYEPKLEEIWILAKQDNAVLSIAHPNFTFKEWIKKFEKELPYYIEKWINAIEINTKSSKDWVESIIKLKEKYNLILTFWSDCHQIWKTDDKHWSFWDINTSLSQEILKENLNSFRKKLEFNF